MQGARIKYFHLAMAIIWTLLVIPTLIWWNKSVLWVALMSIYACIGVHLDGYGAARAEESNS